MKKIFILILFTIATNSIFSQNEFDAVKYSQTDIVGSARYMGMAGAFGAVGGDMSGIEINPAGLGVFRRFELSLGFGAVGTQNKSTLENESSIVHRTHIPFNNFGFVLAFNSNKESGILNNNFSFTYNKLKNFNYNTTVSGSNLGSSLSDYMADMTNGLLKTDLDATNPYNNTEIGFLSILGYKAGLIEPTESGSNTWQSSMPNETVNSLYNARESGYVNEWKFAYSMNVNNVFYWGLSVGITDLFYKKETFYKEEIGSLGDFSIDNSFRTEGIGANFGLGIIFRPIDQIRLGAAVKTPTIYSSSAEDYGLEDSQRTSISSSKTTLEEYCSSNSYYQFISPWKYNFSAAFILGHRGLISLDYELMDYAHMRLIEDYGGTNGFSTENNNIKKLKMTHSLRAGLEIHIGAGVFARLGYAFVTSPFNDVDLHRNDAINTVRTDTEYFREKWTNYYSGGLGWRNSHWFVDLAYLLKHTTADFYAYNWVNLPAANLLYLHHNVAISAGYKF